MNILTLMLLVANLANTKWVKKTEEILKPWHMGTHQRVLSEIFPMYTNMTVLEMVCKFCFTVFLTKEASALEGLISIILPDAFVKND